MENWERRFGRVQPPESVVASHRDGLRKRLQSDNIPAGHNRRAVATLGIAMLVILSGFTAAFPGLAKGLWKNVIVQTITLHTQDGHTILVKKIECNGGECPSVCDTAACDSSWRTPDGRTYFRKRIRSNSCSTDGPIRLTCIANDTSRITSLLQAGLEFTKPSGETMRISSPDGNRIWIVNGDTITSAEMSVSVGGLPESDDGCIEHTADSTAGVRENQTGLSTNFELLQNYPNPFNPTTQISFDMKQSGPVTLKVYNMMGQEIATLLNGNTEAGHHTVAFDGTHLPSGTYLYTLKASGFQASKRMILAK
jgi:hypothetical protein